MTTTDDADAIASTAPPTPRPGTARAALGVRDFRIMWGGAFASNIGTWMQNVVLGAYAYELTGSPAYVSLIVFAQLGPLLILSVVGGALADSIDRRKLLVVAQLEQLVASVVLAVLVAGGDPSRMAVFLAVLAVGIGNAINAPAYVAVLPSLVPRDDLPAAISLNTAQMNGSRVVGPAIGGLLFPLIGAAGVFAVNAATYLFAVVAVLLVHPPPLPPRRSDEPEGVRRLLSGFAIARRDPLVRRVLVSLFLFSFLCLPFVGQLPTVAEENLGIDTESAAYGLLYATFGVGSVAGSMAVGTILADRSRIRLLRAAMVTFAVSLAILAFISTPVWAYLVIAVVGFAYFASITALNTALQTHLDDQVRGRVMSLWIMAFGGTVPLGLLVAGPIAEATSITFVLLYGAVAALGLAWYAHVRGVRAGADAATPEQPPGGP